MSLKLLLSQVEFVKKQYGNLWIANSISYYLFDLDQDLEFCITDGDIFHFVYKDALDVV